MARVTVEDCVARIPNRFDLVLLAAHRVRMLRSGFELSIPRGKDKDPVLALREIADSDLDPEIIRQSCVADLQETRQNEELEREADRVALQAGPATSEADVLRAYESETEVSRDDRS